MTTTVTTTVELELASRPSRSLEIQATSALPAAREQAVEATNDAEPDLSTNQPEHQFSVQFFLNCLAISLVLILGGLDMSIIPTVVPSLTNQFHTLADVGWYSAAYRLSVCSLQFTVAKLYKIFPVKRVFLSCLVVFMIGTVLCAAATSSKMFVIGRAVTGAGAAGFLPGCFVLLVHLVPREKRPVWQAGFYSTELVITNIGPFLGGVIVQNLSWRWCFWINLPIGGVVILAIAFVLPATVDNPACNSLTRKEKFRQLDIMGNLVFIPSLTCLFIALGWAGIKYPWNSPIIIGLLVTFAVLLGAFIYDQHLKQDTATIPPRVIKNRSVIASACFAFCMTAASSVIQYYMPTYFQAVHGYSPAEAGLMMLAVSVSFTVALVSVGAGTNLIGYYNPFLYFSSVLQPIAAGLISTWSVHTSRALLIVYAAILGFSSGVGSQGPSTAVQTTLPSADITLGVAIVLFSTNFGPALFVPIAQTIFSNRLSENLHHLAPQLNVTSIENMGFADLRTSLGPDNLGKVVLGFDESLRETWYLGVSLACMTILGSLAMEWRSVKHKAS